MNFVDIHTHILPGVDDGAQSLEDTLVMLRIAYDSGTRRMVATPHMFLDLFNNNDFLEIRDRFEALIRDLNSYQEKQPHIKEMDLYLGAENYASPEFLESTRELDGPSSGSTAKFATLDSYSWAPVFLWARWFIGWSVLASRQRSAATGIFSRSLYSSRGTWRLPGF